MSIACTLHGPLDLRLEARDQTTLAEHEVRLRLGAGGICGSDLHYYQHGRVGAFQIREPFVPGHEASAVVEAVGASVSRVKPGDRVAVNPSHACGECDYCRQGRLNLCRRMFFLGSASVFPHAQGMFREHFVMHEHQLTAVTEDVSLGEIACAEPLSIGLHAVTRAGGVAGQRVLITGGGTIGCMSAIAARVAGAAEVIVCDVAERPLEMARRIGADRVLRTDQMKNEELKDLADVAIEAAGHPSAVLTCLAAVKRGGKVVQVGTLPAEMSWPGNEIMVRELDYLGAFRADMEFDWAVRLIRSRAADMRPLITAQLPLSRAREAFELALDRSCSTKVQLVAD